MVISNTKWEVNMTRKYRVASSATTPKILGAPNAGILDRIARVIISENARKSGAYSFSRISVIPTKFNDSWAPYKSAMLMHATNRLLCSTNAQIRYASRGTSGMEEAAYEKSQHNMRTPRLIVAHLTRELGHTSFTHCKNNHPHPNPKLRGGNDHESNRGGNVSHRHSIYPGTNFSKIN